MKAHRLKLDTHNSQLMILPMQAMKPVIHCDVVHEFVL